MSFLEMEVTTKIPDVDAATEAVMDAILNDTENEAIASLLYPKHGRAYIRPHDKPHIASAPGEPPASDSGDLMDSIKSERFGDVGYVTASVLYAEYLEHGTSRMAPRPFLGPAWRYAMAKHPEKLFSARMEV